MESQPNLTRILLLSFAALVGSRSAAAQRYLVHNYTEQEGLPVSETFDVDRDRDGRLWCATRAGLVVYDGATWEFVRAPDRMPIRDIQELRFDSRGRAWAFTSKGSVLEGTIEGLDAIPRDPGSKGRTPLLLDADVLELDGRVVVAVADLDRVLSLWNGVEWKSVEGLVERIGALRAVEAAAGCFFVGGDRGLVTVSPEASVGTTVALPEGLDPSIRGLLWERDEQGEHLWVQGVHWIGLLGEHGVELVARDIPSAEDAAADPLVQAPDGRGGLYYATVNALYHFDRRKGVVRSLGKANGLVAEGARGLLLDHEGLLWVATPLGLSKLVGMDWEAYGPEEGLLHGETSALVELEDGHIVLGHNDGLTFQTDDGFQAYAFRHELEGGPGRTRVMDLATDPDGNLWIAGSQLGLGRMGPDRDLEWFRPPTPEASWAVAVLCDARGRIWLGTSRGLLRLEERALRPIGEVGIDVEHIRCLVEAPDGRLLAGGESGVWIGTDAGWSRVQAEGPDAGRGIFSILVDSRGDTWVGARDGLWRVEGRRLVRPALHLPGDRAVYTLLEDDAGRLWLGTDFGVYLVEGARLEHFTVRSGLSGNETNRAAGLVDRDGAVWLGTERGLSIFRPQLERRRPPPTVELVAVESGSVRHPVATNVRLQAGREELVFWARARSLVDEHSLAWRTWLEGHEASWHEVAGGAVHDERYSRLPPGRYRFHVRTRQADGEWGPVASTATVELLGPFWRQRWFHLSAIAVTAVLGAAGYRLYSQRRLARELEAEVRRRTEELALSQRELARTERLRSLGLLAGGIAHDFNNVLTALTGGLSLLRLRLAGEPEHAPLLDTCDQALERASQLSSQLLTFSKGGEPVTRAIAAEALVKDSVRLVLSGSTVKGELDLPDGLWSIRADPAQVYQAFENLLLNARQSMPAGGTVHVRASNVELETDEGGLWPGRYVRLEIADEGPGIPPEVLPRIFEPFFTTKAGGSGLGLATAHSVAVRHGGRLTASSRAGGGATFTLHLPAADDTPAAASLSIPPRDTPRRPGHVLVMDDEPVVRTLLVEILEVLGREVTVTVSGEEALRALEAARASGVRFSCAILDLTVPGAKGGRETLADLRRVDPTLPAIATSGYTEDAILARPGEAGFQAGLAKPFRIADVAAALDAAEQD